MHRPDYIDICCTKARQLRPTTSPDNFDKTKARQLRNEQRPPADGPGLHHTGPPGPGPAHHTAQQWAVYITGDNVTRLEIPLSSTIASGFTGLTAADFAVAALPLSAVLVLFFAIQSVLLYSTADFLTAAAFVNAAKFFACQPSDPGAIVAMSLAAVALMLRVCSSTAC